MRYNIHIRYYALLVAWCLFATSAHAQLVKKQDLVNAWSGMAEYTVALAENMPEEQYAYKVDPIVRDFGGQMVHIAESNYFIVSILNGDSEKFNKDAKSKKEIITELQKSFDFVANALDKITLKELEEEIDFFDGNKRSRYRAYLLLVDHLTHTRGISISYLRAKGIAPPDFTSW